MKPRYLSVSLPFVLTLLLPLRSRDVYKRQREHDPRVAIDDELGGRARPSQVGNAGLRRSAALQRRKDGEEDKRNGDRQGSRFHLGWLEGSVRVILIGRL